VDEVVRKLLKDILTAHDLGRVRLTDQLWERIKLALEDCADTEGEGNG